MGFFLVKSPLAVAIGAALVLPGEVVELDDDEGARLVANGTVDEAPDHEPKPAAPKPAKPAKP